MKKTYKFILFTLIVAMTLSIYTSVYAESHNTLSKKKPILEVIEEHEENDILGALPWSEDVQEYDFSDDVILTEYWVSFNFWKYAEESIDDLIARAEKDSDFCFKKSYIVFEDIPLRLSEKIDRNTNSSSLEINNLSFRDGHWPLYLQDITQSAIYESEINNENMEYTKVVCFNTNYYGINVYYIGENGTIVRHYEDSYTPAIDFTLSEFQKWGPVFWEYRKLDSSLSYYFSSGIMPFGSFYENKTKLIEAVLKRYNTHKIIFISVLSLDIIGIGTLIFILKKERKKA